MAEKEYRVNECISLKLETEKDWYGNEITKINIYVGEKKIRSCKKLIINDPHLDYRLDDINSIDEVAVLYKKPLKDRGKEIEEQLEEDLIDSETEFWGHCSNIQAWVEHDYDTRLLAVNIAFPVLKELSDIGVPNAKIVFQEELVKRFQSGYTPVIEYLYLMKYHKLLTLEQKIDIDFLNIMIPQRERLRQVSIRRIEEDWCLSKEEKKIKTESLKKSFLDLKSEFN